MTNRTFLRAAAVCLAVPACALFAAGPALAAGDVVVTNQETIQAHLDATGKVMDARVYDQLAFTGQGKVDVANPVSTKGLRNLDGFGGYDVKNGKLVTTVDVDGDKRLRTVSDFDRPIPLKVSATYLLGGKEVAPDKVVGAHGELEVRYRVENVTAASQQITFDDGTGQQVTKDAQVVIPMVGSLTTVLPSTFTDVSSAQANMAGDGRGGTKLSFTMTLFGPIGSATSEFGYTARIKDGLVPSASISALPVSPLESPSFKGGAESYKGGADTGVELTAGATEIDANLLKLRDGAGQLLAGLIQLRDGANQLNAGLAGEAAPGAAKLAAGASDAAVGADKLAAGAARAAGIADDKVPTLVGALHQVQGGLGQLDAGLATMSSSIGGLDVKAQPLHDGIAKLMTGIGTTQTHGTLLYAVNGLRSGLSGDAVAGITKLTTSMAEAAAALKSVNTADARSQATLDAIIGKIGTAADAPSSAGTAIAGLKALGFGLTHEPGTLGSTDPGGAVEILAAVQCGLDNGSITGVCPEAPGLKQGLAALDAGIDQLVEGVVNQVQAGIGTPKSGPGTLRGGVAALRGGVDQITAGGEALAGGLRQLGVGAGQLADGNRQIAKGANDLAAGLNDAAVGSGQLADGLATAAESAPQLEEGAQRLSDEGTKKLVEAGKGTAADYGEKYALIVAGAERAKSEGMAYGAPEGAAGVTAYSLELAGMDGEGGRNVTRGLGALVVLGLGTGAAALVRRRFV